MPQLFITGTDTGVGKTVVTGLLAAALAMQSHRVCVFKPVQTGANDLLAPEDPVQIRHWLAHPPPEVAPVQVAWQYVFALPAAPYVAADLATPADAPEGGAIAVAAILAKAQQLALDCDWLLIEGAGGVCVPLNATETVLDLMATLHHAMGCLAVVVARPHLGTINHSVLTHQALVSRAIPVAGVVVSGMPDLSMPSSSEWDLSVPYLPQVLAQWLPADCQTVYLPTLTPEVMTSSPGGFWRFLVGHPEILQSLLTKILG
jgi:dethiobiotin synthetase